MHFCPGCGYPAVLRLLAEALDGLGLGGRTVGVPPTGCAAPAHRYLAVDWGEAPPGLGPAVAAGLKSALPGAAVLALMGPEDLAAGGAGELWQAAQEGDSVTVVVVNHGWGRLWDLAPMLAAAPGSAFAARAEVASSAGRREAGRALRRALAVQDAAAGLAVVELLAPCPTRWSLDPEAADRRVRREMAAVLPLGTHKDRSGLEPEAGP
jgi:2-oxoglutarate ferredoxin oxidoreductase subunit beta